MYNVQSTTATFSRQNTYFNQHHGHLSSECPVRKEWQCNKKKRITIQYNNDIRSNHKFYQKVKIFITPFSFSNLKSAKRERSLKGTGSSCNNRTFNVDADNDDDDDDDDDDGDDNDDDDYCGGGCGGVNRELKQLRRQPQRRLQKNNRFNNQNNSSERASLFLVHFFDVHCTTMTWSLLIWRFIEDVDIQRWIFLPLFEPE